MGFGTLFFGYFLLLNITYYSFTDLIAALIAAMGLYKLSSVNRPFKNGFYASVIFGFIGYMVLQILLIIILFIFALFNKDIMNLFYTSEIINIETIKTLILYGIIGYTTTLIIAFITSLKLFNKGVNVD